MNETPVEFSDWVEVRLRPGAKPIEFYRWLATKDVPKGVIGRTHHFWDEPWNPGAYVVRVEMPPDELVDEDLRGELPDVVREVVSWDDGAKADEALYGKDWASYVFGYFEIVSMLSTAEADEFYLSKFVHCQLNAYGLSVAEEARWALRFAWHRVTLRPRLWWRRRS